MSDPLDIQPAALAPNLTVAELLNRWAQAASVFVNFRMACVGCPLASFETLDSAAKVYGLPLMSLMGKLEKTIERKGD